MKDPIVQEVRETRHRIEKECSNDSKLFFHHYLEYQKQYDERLVDANNVKQIIQHGKKGNQK